MARTSPRSASRSDVSSRTPHSGGPSARATASAVSHRVVLEVDEHGDVHRAGVAVREGPRRRGGVAAVRGDQAVRHGADAPAAPPRRLRVGRDADRPRDVGRPAVAGLHEPVVVAGGEEQDRLAGRGLDDGADVAHHERPPGQAAEVDRLEVGEAGVGPLDRHHGLPRRDRVALVERADLELAPAVDPRAVRRRGARRIRAGRRSPRRCRRAATPCAGRPARPRAGRGPRARAAPWSG